MNDIHSEIKNNKKPANKTGLMIWYRLARIYGRELKKTADHLRQWNISAAQFDVLAQVGSKEGLTQKELADRLFVTQGNITQLLDKMTKLGLIEKSRIGRSKILSLTPEGRKFYSRVVPKQELYQSKQFDVLTDEEKQQLLKLLRKLDHTK
jgi:DNA-binding MarR family transcriptional regulator